MKLSRSLLIIAILLSASNAFAKTIPCDDENVYFYLEAREPITPAFPDGLCLALDLDDDLSTGWRGADGAGRAHEKTRARRISRDA